MEIGMIGFGNFGKFFAKTLATVFEVSVWDCINFNNEATKMNVKWASLEKVASKEVVILAIPLAAMESTLSKLVYNINSDVLIMDVCSVKLEPIRLIRQYLPKAKLLATHPMFGPQGTKNGWGGQQLVVCPVEAPSKKSELMLRFFCDQQLRLIEMTAEQHDKEIAIVLGLTYFIGQGLKEYGIENLKLTTTTFEHLRKITDIVGNESWELFKTIQNGNPFVAEIRRQFMEALQNIEKRLKSTKNNMNGLI
ncbi:MAG: prephenate dehydrogenase [Candidatus Staskawiczbacteria bacterium]|nr:prephenate dehydrogenase [Candidatus Staskawiczbacteria bacterium]